MPYVHWPDIASCRGDYLSEMPLYLQVIHLPGDGIHVRFVKYGRVYPEYVTSEVSAPFALPSRLLPALTA
jgi:hypothetical protein